MVWPTGHLILCSYEASFPAGYIIALVFLSFCGSSLPADYVIASVFLSFPADHLMALAFLSFCETSLPAGYVIAPVFFSSCKSASILVISSLLCLWVFAKLACLLIVSLLLCFSVPVKPVFLLAISSLLCLCSCEAAFSAGYLIVQKEVKKVPSVGVPYNKAVRCIICKKN